MWLLRGDVTIFFAVLLKDLQIRVPNVGMHAFNVLLDRALFGYPLPQKPQWATSLGAQFDSVERGTGALSSCWLDSAVRSMGRSVSPPCSPESGVWGRGRGRLLGITRYGQFRLILPLPHRATFQGGRLRLRDRRLTHIGPAGICQDVLLKSAPGLELFLAVLALWHAGDAVFVLLILLSGLLARSNVNFVTKRAVLTK